MCNLSNERCQKKVFWDLVSEKKSHPSLTKIPFPEGDGEMRYWGVVENT